MLSFPVPYPDELLYSTIARAGIHCGITSPKELLDEVFGNRKVIATVDLPCHLQQVADNYPASLQIDTEALAYRHTLFPLYAPFVSEDRRKRALLWLGSSSQGAAHLALGIAASRVRAISKMRYCPACLAQQLAKHGEYYWLRQWQVTGADCCLQHGALYETNLPRHSRHRHEFVPASPKLCPPVPQSKSCWQAAVVARQVAVLLAAEPSTSASFSQWTSYYAGLLRQQKLNCGSQMNFDLVKQRIVGYWSQEWLSSIALEVTDQQSCWLRGIFRKHRKSFSYLEHIIALGALLPSNWSIGDVIKSVRTAPAEADKPTETVASLPFGLSQKLPYRRRWLAKAKQFGVKLARHHGGGADYAWLYRHDQSWLMECNRRYQLAIPIINRRVEWHKRDRQFIRQLCQLREQFETQLSSPRWSRNWYLSKLEQAATAEKKLSKLPLTRLFFARYSESVPEYQIRRITVAVTELLQDSQTIRRWKVLRKAGLSDERLKASSRQFLEMVVREYGQFSLRSPN